MEQIERVVKDINPRKLVEDMKAFDTYIQTDVLPKWRERLP